MWHEGSDKDDPGTELGTAEVDLSLVPIMGQISGWYNIAASG